MLTYASMSLYALILAIIENPHKGCGCEDGIVDNFFFIIERYNYNCFLKYSAATSGWIVEISIPV